MMYANFTVTSCDISLDHNPTGGANTTKKNCPVRNSVLGDVPRCLISVTKASHLWTIPKHWSCSTGFGNIWTTVHLFILNLCVLHVNEHTWFACMFNIWAVPLKASMAKTGQNCKQREKKKLSDWNNRVDYWALVVHQDKPIAFWWILRENVRLE